MAEWVTRGRFLVNASHKSIEEQCGVAGTRLAFRSSRRPEDSLQGDVTAELVERTAKMILVAKPNAGHEHCVDHFQLTETGTT